MKIWLFHEGKNNQVGRQVHVGTERKSLNLQQTNYLLLLLTKHLKGLERKGNILSCSFRESIIVGKHGGRHLKQEAERSFIHIYKQRTQTGSDERLWTLQSPPQWLTSSQQATHPQRSIASLNSATKWRPTVQTPELMTAISHSNHHICWGTCDQESP